MFVTVIDDNTGAYQQQLTQNEKIALEQILEIDASGIVMTATQLNGSGREIGEHLFITTKLWQEIQTLVSEWESLQDEMEF